MRRVLYVPVIHVDSDLGSIAPAIEKRSAEVCGKDRWEKHKQTVKAFWDVIEDHFKKLDPRHLKIYQDGLMAEGDLGRKIVEEGARRGSRNYQIVLGLIKRGAEIRKTEDIELLKEELNQILSLAGNGPTSEGAAAETVTGTERRRLLEKRDRFIANAINGTLRKEETGVLFIGAFHNVSPHLAEDISVKEIKDSQKVRDYFSVLISGGDDKKFNELAIYLMSEGGRRKAEGSGQKVVTSE
jgi:hypothetical protein